MFESDSAILGSTSNDEISTLNNFRFCNQST